MITRLARGCHGATATPGIQLTGPGWHHQARKTVPASQTGNTTPYTTHDIPERAGLYRLTQARTPNSPGPWFTGSGLRLLASMEYDVEYVVRDIESLLFWLHGLDCTRADLDGAAALASAQALNRVLAQNVDERGFVTNEHRYLAIAQSARRPC